MPAAQVPRSATQRSIGAASHSTEHPPVWPRHGRGPPPGLLARCWTAQQHTVDRDDVNLTAGTGTRSATPVAVIKTGLFPVVPRSYDWDTRIRVRAAMT